MQLCHPDLHNEFPPLRTSEDADLQHLPTQMTTFVGREAQMADVQGLLGQDRLVTLTGAGGIGNMRRAAMKLTTVSVVVRPGWSGRPKARATVTGTSPELVMGARSTHHAPCANSVVMCFAICTANRV
jgi:hypothetical protein